MGYQIRDYENVLLSGQLQKDTALVRQIFQKDDILRVRNLRISHTKVYGTLFYMDGMVNTEVVNESIVRALITADLSAFAKPTAAQISAEVLYANDVSEAENLAKILQGILYGDTVLLIDGSKTALVMNTKGFKTRGVQEPPDEHVLRGPREGFEETAMLNIAMIRRRLQTPDLCVQMQRIGRRSQTVVFVCYLNSLANGQTVQSLKKRLEKIDIDGILDSNYIAEHIRDHRYSLFKTTGSTERPDVVAARLLEGRIAVVVDGSPVVLTVPFLFAENFQTEEDYYSNFFVASIGRFLRYCCFFLAFSVPAIFVALTTFHLQLLPTPFMMSVARLRSGVPMSSVVECVALILVFEILKETGLRTPQGLGTALSIVGGLVIGQAAVEAKIVSAPMLIVVAFSGIAGLMVPRLQGLVFYLRLLAVLAAALFGLFGYATVLFIFFARLFSVHSFKVDYTLAMRRPNNQRFQDVFWRVPWPKMKFRPAFNRNRIRSRLRK